MRTVNNNKMKRMDYKNNSKPEELLFIFFTKNIIFSSFTERIRCAKSILDISNRKCQTLQIQQTQFLITHKI